MTETDLYSFLSPSRERELRRHNKERLAKLEAEAAERQARFQMAADAWHAEKAAKEDKRAS